MKKLTMLLVLAMLLALIASCARDEVEETTTPTPPADEVTTPAAQEPAVEPELEPEEDPPLFEPRDIGRTIRVACWWQYMRETGEGTPDPATATNYFLDRLRYDNQTMLEETFNVTFTNLVTPQPYIMTNLTASVMAGDPFAEWVMIPRDGMIAAITGDLVQNIGDFAPPTSDLMTNQMFVEQRVRLFGNLYGFGRADLRIHGVGLGVNLDLIDATGAPNPVDLFNNGQWTWDAMREVMAIGTQDTTGDGTTDQFGISGYMGHIIRGLIASNNGVIVDEDTLQFAMEDPRTLEALEFLSDIFDNGWWAYDLHGANIMGDWGRNTYFYLEGRSLLFPIQSWMMDEQPADFEFTIVPFPTGPNASHYTTIDGFYQAIMIPEGIPNPEDILMLYEELHSWARHEPAIQREGVYGHMRRVWQTEECVQRVLHVVSARDNEKFDLGFAVPQLTWVFGTFAHYMFHGTQTPMQIIETQRPYRQEMIDEAFGR